MTSPIGMRSRNRTPPPTNWAVCPEVLVASRDPVVHNVMDTHRIAALVRPLAVGITETDISDRDAANAGERPSAFLDQSALSHRYRPTRGERQDAVDTRVPEVDRYLLDHEAGRDNPHHQEPQPGHNPNPTSAPQ